MLPPGQDVFGRQQPFLDGGGDAALEHDRLARVAQLAQQREVLHVPRADLKDVGVLVDDLDLADVHHLGDQLEIVGVGGIAQQPQALFAETLEAVGRAARLEGAAAQHLGARALDGRGRRMHLVLGLRRARAGHDDDLVAADADFADGEDGVVGLEGAAGELVGLADAQHFVDAVEHLDEARVDLAAADDAEHGARGAARAVHVHAELDEVGDDLFDLRVARALFHDDNHDLLLPRRG